MQHTCCPPFHSKCVQGKVRGQLVAMVSPDFAFVWFPTAHFGHKTTATCRMATEFVICESKKKKMNWRHLTKISLKSIHFGDATICDCRRYEFGVMLCIFGVEFRPDLFTDEIFLDLLSPNANELVCTKLWPSL